MLFNSLKTIRFGSACYMYNVLTFLSICTNPILPLFKQQFNVLRFSALTNEVGYIADSAILHTVHPYVRCVSYIHVYRASCQVVYLPITCQTILEFIPFFKFHPSYLLSRKYQKKYTTDTELPCRQNYETQPAKTIIILVHVI